MQGIQAGRRSLIRRGLLVLCALSLMLAVCAIAATPRAAEAKSYYVSDVKIEAEARPDGSMKVVERRTFSFSGSFSWVEQDLALRGTQGITDIVVSEGSQRYRLADAGTGTYSYQTIQSTTGDLIRVTWRFSAADQQRTFELSYLAKGVVLVHEDVAELYWKFVGSEWEVEQRNIVVGLTLPAGADIAQVRAWGHGPLAGEVDIESPARVVWRLGRVPKFNYLEGRVVFPKALVPQAARFSGRPGLQKILDEEGELVDKANRDRLLALGGVVAGVLALIGAVIAALVVQARYGREHRPQFEGDYYRELPGDYSPAELGCLWRFGPVGATDMTATILDLARRGYLTIEVRTEESRGLFGTTRRDTDYLLKRVERRTQPLSVQNDPGKLREHERLLLSFFFDEVGAGRDEMNFNDIRVWAKSHPVAMQAFVKAFEGSVRGTGAAEEFFDKRTEQVRVWELVAGLFVFIGGMALMVTGTPVAGVPAMLAGAILVIGGVGLRRRSQIGSTHLAMWRAFRRFLQHFSAMDTAEVPSLVIWEHYLVYAVVLGVAKEVLEQLRVVYPQVAQAQPGFHPWIWMQIADPRISPVSMVGSLTEALQSSVATAVNYRPSSRGGFGGGFSGGGGHGGGGGGGRAG